MDSIAGLTEEGRYERNYLTVYELMTHTDDMSTEDLYQYSTVGPTVMLKLVWIIRIYHECEGRIEKSVPRINIWHHKACQVMKRGDIEGQNFSSPEPKTQGELIVWDSSRRLSVRPHFQT